jgi:hypothetical protein
VRCLHPFHFEVFLIDPDLVLDEAFLPVGVLTRRGLEELKGRVAALEEEKISTETVERTVDKSLLTFRGGANGPRRWPGLAKT